MHSIWWLAGALVAGGGAVMIAAVLILWYGFSFVVLGTIGRLFPLRGWKPRGDD